MFSPLIDQLITALRKLPGVGPKSAQRMAFHLLEHDRSGAMLIAGAIGEAVENVGQCGQCRNLTENPVCHICASAQRDKSTICVVESPADVLAFEQSGIFSGVYFVLHGHLSPIDGVGPDDIGIDVLTQRLGEGTVKELIIATNPTMEGEATSHYISERAKSAGVKVSRIAHGVPIGGELEFIDGGTLAHALTSRREIV